MCCVMCETPMPPIDEAIDAGWMPSYYDGDDPCDGPVCPECCERRCMIARDGELELTFPEIRLNV